VFLFFETLKIGFELKLKINEEFIIVQNIKENKNKKKKLFEKFEIFL